MSNDPSRIPVPPIPFEYGLPRIAKCLTGLGPIKIVTLGSSTTAGEGEIVAYPYRLEALLRQQYPGLMIDVLNRGIGGQEAPVELGRMQRDVISEQPSLVIWQVGTNAVWQSPDLNPPPPTPDETIADVRKGLALLRAKLDADVILMDLQYVPALLTPAKKYAAEQMVSSLRDVAKEFGVNIFRRFELMQGWHEIEKISFDRMVDPTDSDRLHDSDWATQRVSWALRDEIVRGIAKANTATTATG